MGGDGGGRIDANHADERRQQQQSFIMLLRNAG